MYYLSIDDSDDIPQFFNVIKTNSYDLRLRELIKVAATHLIQLARSFKLKLIIQRNQIQGISNVPINRSFDFQEKIDGHYVSLAKQVYRIDPKSFRSWLGRETTCRECLSAPTSGDYISCDGQLA